jgi:hypothetical protein
LDICTGESDVFHKVLWNCDGDNGGDGGGEFPFTWGDAYGGAVIFRSPERYSIPHLSVNGERASQAFDLSF